MYLFYSTANICLGVSISSSYITTHSSSCSVVHHTISQLPQRLTVRGPANQFVTVQAVSGGHDRSPQSDGDQWYTLPVSILDSSSGAPVNSVVALQGDQQAPTDGVMVCYLSVTVVDQRSQGRAGPASQATHRIERNSQYTVNGRASFRMCFSVAETRYLISVGVVCIQDEEGVECIGYNVEQYTADITTVTARMKERNAFKTPPPLKFEDPLTSKKCQKLMAMHTNLFYRYEDDKAVELVSKVTSNDYVSLDIKLYLSIEQLHKYSVNNVEAEAILRKCQSLACQNGYLLQAHAMVILAYSYSHTGDHEKALECIHDSRSLCIIAEPSYITSWIFYVEAFTLIKKHEGNITPSIRKNILELFDRAIGHSYYGTGWERYMVCCSHIHKALFCLSGTIYYHDFNPNYTPTEEDILLAEQHLNLNAVPVDEFSKLTTIKAQYHIALSDVNRLRGKTTIAIQHAEQAKQLYAEAGISRKYLDDRLQYLQSDPIDTILAEYEDQV